MLLAQVTPATATAAEILWPTPADIIYGTPLTAQSQLNATSTVPGTFTYDPPPGTILAAGNGQSLSVAFTPDDTTNHAPVTTNVFINVLKKNLTITAVNKAKVYAAPLPALTATYSGFVNGDTPASLDTALTLSTTGTAGSGVGSYPINPSGAADANYAITFVPGTLTVTPAPLTITAENRSRPYGGAAPVWTADYAGLVNGDTPASLDTPVSFSTTATAASPLGVYPITASGAADANYAITFAPGTLTVTRAALTITAENKTKVYGGGLPTLTASYTGFVNGETSAILETQPTLSTAVTTASVVGAYPITASGATAANYAITFVAGTLTVTPAPLAITAINKTKVYGAPLPGLTATYAGFLNGDTPASLDTALTLSTTGTAGSGVGSYPINPSGAADANYAITFVPGTLTVTPAALTITPENRTKFYGAPMPVLTAGYSGLVSGDTPASLDTPVTLSTTVTAASPVGSYPITASGAADANYAIAYGTASFTITPAILTVVADDKSRIYSAPQPALTATYAGFVNNEGPGDLDTPVSLNTTATLASGAGSYPITASGAADANYTVQYQPGTLTITRAATVGSLTSSANPSVPGTGVSFAFAASAVSPATAKPTGTVGFRVNGVVVGQIPLSGGEATLLAFSLPAGTNTISAEYAGDGNFIGATNLLLQLINTPPVAGQDTIPRWPATGAKVAVATLLTNDSDADGDGVTFVSFSPISAHGGAVSLTNGWILYVPPAGFTNNDSFTYTITDGRGELAVGSVIVAISTNPPPQPRLAIQSLGNGSSRIQVDAISGIHCQIEYADNPVSPNWRPLVSGNANAYGLFEWVDTPPPGEAQRYYRSVYP
jgi:hypothetical protein